MSHWNPCCCPPSSCDPCNPLPADLECRLAALEANQAALFSRTEDLRDTVLAVQTGVIAYAFATELDGWILLSQEDSVSIGSDESEATNPGSTVQALYNLLWEVLSDTVSLIKDEDGNNDVRGASAAEDWEANKCLFIPTAEGKVIAGRDQSTAVLGTLPNAVGTVQQLGASGGEATHVLVEGELAAHSHGITNPPLSRFISATATAGAVPDDSLAGFEFLTPATQTDAFGDNIAHNTVQPTLIANAFIKL